MFADFYMSHIEGKVSVPHVYVMFVDIFCVLNSQRHIRFFKQRREDNCILKITTEEMTTDKFRFLDNNIKRSNEIKLQTGVYVKPTDSRTYASFESHTTLNYKR